MNTEYDRFSGQVAVDRLAEHWALQDARISNVWMDATAGWLNGRLTCVPRTESAVEKAIIDLRQVMRFELTWSVQDADFYFVPGYTAILRSSGTVYISLDSYDDRAGSRRPSFGRGRLAFRLEMPEPEASCNAPRPEDTYDVAPKRPG